DSDRVYPANDFDDALPALAADQSQPLDLPEVIPAGERNTTLYTVGRSLHAKGVALSTIMKALLEENRVHCSPPLGEAEVRTIAAHTVQQPDRADFRMSPRHLTDLGNARFLIKQHGVDLRYVRAWKRWQVWTGTHWDRSERGQAEQRAKLAVGALYTEATR